MNSSLESNSRKWRRFLSKNTTENVKINKSETDVNSTIGLGLHIKAIKMFYHLEGNRAAKKEFDCIFTETEVDITDSSYEDSTPEQDEEDKEAQFLYSLFKDKLVHGKGITCSLINLFLSNQCSALYPHRGTKGGVQGRTVDANQKLCK